MPKTTKTTRKSSVASGKKLGLKSRFNLRSKKVQFFVVIGIVAILGGGYYTVRSFAATGTITAQATTSNNKSASGHKLLASQGASYFTDSSKNNTTVVAAQYNQAALTSTMPIISDIIVPCVTVRASTPSTAIFTGVASGGKGANQLIGRATPNINIGTNYNDICLGEYITQHTKIDLSVINKKPGTTIYVSRIYIKGLK